MIYKTLRWKGKGGWSKLIQYVLTERDKYHEEGNFTIYHNIRKPQIEQAIYDFTENDTYRTSKRKDAIIAYHEVLTFSDLDKDKITIDMLYEIAQYFISIRGNEALCIAKPHFDTDNPHIHFVFSANKLRTNDLLRMDNKVFREIQCKIEEFQLKNFPELTNSIVYLNKPKNRKQDKKKSDKNQRSQRELELKKRGIKTQKELVTEKIVNALQKSSNIEEFYCKLQNEGLENYKYRNKTKGILFEGRKYRFSTLGLEQDIKQKLEFRLRELEKLQEINIDSDLDITF